MKWELTINLLFKNHYLFLQNSFKELITSDACLVDPRESLLQILIFVFDNMLNPPLHTPIIAPAFAGAAGGKVIFVVIIVDV